MFVYISSTLLLLIATFLISRKFGWWAAFAISGVHIIANTIDFFVAGNLTTFRQAFYSLTSFIILYAYFKTVERLGL